MFYSCVKLMLYRLTDVAACFCFPAIDVCKKLIKELPYCFISISLLSVGNECIVSCSCCIQGKMKTRRYQRRGKKRIFFALLSFLFIQTKQSTNCQNRKSEKSQILSQSTRIELNITIKKIIIILGPSLTRKLPSTGA